MPENVKNFLLSKDTLYENYKAGYKLIIFAGLLFFVLFEVLLYAFQYELAGKKTGLVDFVVAIVFAVFGTVDFIVGCIANPVKIYPVYYGVMFQLLSCYILYIAVRIALFPLSAWYGFLGVGIWAVLSAICILGIRSNIKHNRYREDYKYTIWSNDKKTNEKYGFVFTKYTVISIVFLGLLFLALILMYFAFFPKLFTSSTKALIRGFQLLLVCCMLLLGFFANFSWKLFIKLWYIRKYNVDSLE